MPVAFAPGECFARRRSDINFERGDVIVQHKLIWKRNGLYSIICVVKQKRQKAGPAYDDKGFLFASKLGLPPRSVMLRLDTYSHVTPAL